MTQTSRTMRVLCTPLACGAPVPVMAQSVDTVHADPVRTDTGRADTVLADTVQSDTAADRLGLWARTSRASGLVISSGKTYNRVEGLPVYIGPVFHDSIRAADLNPSLMGISLSSNT